MSEFKARFISVIIRTVITFYSLWVAVLIVDFLSCTGKNTTNCEAERSELRGAFMSIPATLLAWLADSPGQSSKP